MGMCGGLARAVTRQLMAAALDLREKPARRGNIALRVARAGKDLLRLKVSTDREGSMAVTRVVFRGEDVWFAVMSIAGGELRLRSGYSRLFLDKAGAHDVAGCLERLYLKTKDRSFRRRLAEVGGNADGEY